jgi:flagellar protein FliL
MAPASARSIWSCISLCRLRASLTPAGVVMAAKKETQPQDDVEDAPDGDQATKGATVRKWLSLKFIGIAMGAVVALGAVGGGAYHFLGSRSEAAPASTIKPPVFFDMPEVLVNLSSSGNDRTQYLKVKVTLELPNEAMKAEIAPYMPRLMDTFQTYLRELRATDLDGSAGLYRLKEELTRRVNAAIAPERINAVLFKEIVVQ